MSTYTSNAEPPFGEAEEQELAAELLGAGTERELDQFLAIVIRRAARAAGASLRTSLVRSLGALLKGAIRQVLPAAGGRFGNLRPSTATGQLATGAAARLELETEGLSSEDQEFEAARQLIRLIGSAATQAAARPATGSPEQIARQALMPAVRHFAPGLLRPSSSSPHACRCRGSGPCSCHAPASGRWVRQGRRIVLQGI